MTSGIVVSSIQSQETDEGGTVAAIPLHRIYYAPDLQHGSDDSADTSKTVRVLTIMLASEY
jgi:hypothetical protein